MMLGASLLDEGFRLSFLLVRPDWPDWLGAVALEPAPMSLGERLQVHLVSVFVLDLAPLAHD